MACYAQQIRVPSQIVSKRNGRVNIKCIVKSIMKSNTLRTADVEVLVMKVQLFEPFRHPPF